MKKSVLILALVGMVLIICSTSFAATTYVVTNDDNCNAASNTSSIYTLNTSNGALSLATTVKTGGLGNCGGFFAGVQSSITQDAKCLYIVDGGSSDIAAFTTPALKKVGNYSNAAVNDAFPGGSMALTPNGKFLYVSYGGSLNIGAWKRNADCSLTFINAYVAKTGADTYSNLVVDPSGKGLIVSVTDLNALELFLINQTTGALTDLTSTNLNNLSACASAGCFPTGIDITKGELAIVATADNNAITTQLSGSKPYFTKVTYVDLSGVPLINDETIWLSSAAYKTGAGPVYIGFSGDGGIDPYGVMTATLSGSGLAVGPSTAITSSPSGYIGLAESTGSWMVVSEWFNQLQTFKINGDGTLTASAQGPVVDNNADGALSFFIYPNTR
ncbi:MAG: beta-propeller fold lactonase family protein [Terriglobales bacterium]